MFSNAFCFITDVAFVIAWKYPPRSPIPMKSDNARRVLSPEQRKALFLTLKARFEKHPHRHPGLQWDEVQAKLEKHPEKLWSLSEMERTGGEPDVVGQEKPSGEFRFFDCSPESPKGRTGVCYDREGLDSRKAFKPANNAVDMAQAMGIEILTEQEYHLLQSLGEFDTRTTTWVKTPPDIRSLGGALFGDRRFGRVFIYHNGAQSYFSTRGFRGSIRI